MLLAASTQRSIGVVIALAVVAAWMVYVWLGSRSTRPEVGAEIELAANRKPYLPDEELEGSKLDRSLGMGLAFLVIVGVGLPIYWLAEPGRQSGAIVNFDSTFVGRGERLYNEGANCAQCHGPQGVGGVASYILTDVDGTPVDQVAWQAPALNTVMLRYDRDEVEQVLVYGRANSPMPAWGIAGGGPLNVQQISNLLDYLATIQLTPEEAQAAAVAQYGETDGETLFNAYCARCHTQGWSLQLTEASHLTSEELDAFRGPSGGGAFGFNLTNGLTVRQFPDEEDMVDFITKGSELNQPYGERGVGSGRMPGFGETPAGLFGDAPAPGQLTEAQIRAIVEYERSL